MYNRNVVLSNPSKKKKDELLYVTVNNINSVENNDNLYTRYIVSFRNKDSFKYFNTECNLQYYIYIYIS